MTDRVAHEAVRTVDATVERAGPVDRPRVVVTGDAADLLPVDDVVRIVLDGSTYRARPSITADGVVVPGAYDTPAAARDPDDATDRLREWVADRGLDYGRTVHLDVVEEGFCYGLRGPGERAVYDDHTSPPDSLASIAADLEREH